MKTVYTKNIKRRKNDKSLSGPLSGAKAQAMHAYRETRARIDPELLSRAQELAERAFLTPDGYNPDNTHNKAVQGKEPVSRRKNLETVLHLFEKRTHSPEFYRDVARLVAQVQSNPPSRPLGDV